MDWPFFAEVSAKYERKVANITYDANVFPRQTNKITDVGRFKKKKVAVLCDGNGRMHFKFIQTKAQQIKEFAKLRKDGIITDKEFQKEKNKILENDDSDSHSE